MLYVDSCRSVLQCGLLRIVFVCWYFFLFGGMACVGWRVSGMDSWKGRVLSSGGLRGWGFMAGGNLAGHHRFYWGICCVHR